MSSLQTTVKRSASTGANKKKRIQGFFIRIGSPPERKRAASEGNTRRLISRAEEADLSSTEFFGRHPTFARGSASGRDSLRLMGETQMEPCIVEEPEVPKLHQFSSREVAEQLCLLDGEILRRIEPEELNNGAWMKKEKEQLAPNVLAMVRTSNELAMMIPSEILEETTTHGRAKVICSYIKIASRLHRLRNYNSLKAVLAGLQCTPIFRLKKTWKEVPNKRRKKFEKLAELMSEEYNWKLYRAELDECFAENSPCIPFLGVLLTTIVQHETAGSGHSRQLTRNGGRKRISGVEMYTILEAITVRNRLEKLRKQSTNWRLSGIPESNVQRQAFKRSQSHFAKTSNISDSHIQPISELRAEELNKRAILVGESSGSEEDDKCETSVESLRISEHRERAESAERRCSVDIIDSVIEDVGILETSSSDSETTPNSSPVLLPRSSTLEDGDKVLSLRKKRRKLQRLAANQPITEPFSPSHSSLSASNEMTLSAHPSSMKASISESLALDEIMKRTDTPMELFDDLSNSGESQSSCTDSLGSSPAPNSSSTGSKVEPSAKVSLTEVTVQVTPSTVGYGRKPLTRLANGSGGGGGTLVVPLESRRGSDDRTRKVTVLEPPPIEALYDAHYEEYAEVSRSLESLTTACEDLSGGPIPDESADFYLKEVDGELTSYIRKSISLQSLSSLDDSTESHSGSFSSHSDSSSQPSSSSLILPTNIKTGPAHLSNDTTNDNAFEDDVITNDINTSSHSLDRRRLRSNSIDEVFAGIDDPAANHVIPVLRRRLSSDCTNMNKNGIIAASVNQTEKPIEKNELCRKSSYGPVRRRSRRKASLVLRLAQLGADSKNFNSDDHLVKYKFSSLRFISDYQILPELRTLLMTRPRNTEGQNYKLSYKREM